MGTQTQEDSVVADRITGCLLAGAVGDALGGGIEFRSLDEIRQEFGPRGVRGYVPAYGRRGGAITDDTQMTLFTAEGLLRSGATAAHLPPPRAMRDSVYEAYLRWRRTQEPWQQAQDGDDGLLAVPELWDDRAAGRTCLDALASGQMGVTADAGPPINDSKG